MTQESWTHTIAALLPEKPWILAMDRTEWKRGETTVNLLVLSVIAYGCSVPLLWIVMPDCGASDTAERKELVGRFIALFGTDSVKFLTADREFIGKEWVRWLLDNRMRFRIRIKASEYLLHQDGREYRAWEWFALRACRCKSQKMWLWGLPVFVGGKRLIDGKYLIIISDEFSDDLWSDYRFPPGGCPKIETLFQALKGTRARNTFAI